MSEKVLLTDKGQGSMLLKEGEVELWREYGSIRIPGIREEWMWGVFIVTNHRLIFEVEVKGLFGLVKLRKDIIWEMNHGDIKDIAMKKAKILSPRTLHVDGTPHAARFDFGKVSSKVEQKVKDIILDSSKKKKDEEFKEKIIISKAGASLVQVNMDQPPEARPKKKGKKKDIEPVSWDETIECFSCGVEIVPSSIEWIGPGKFQCPSCGGINRRDPPKKKKEEKEETWQREK